jgi:hypothetical protein
LNPLWYLTFDFLNLSLFTDAWYLEMDFAEEYGKIIKDFLVD